jgi:ribosomal protein S27AE
MCTENASEYSSNLDAGQCVGFDSPGGDYWKEVIRLRTKDHCPYCGSTRLSSQGDHWVCRNCGMRVRKLPGPLATVRVRRGR